MSRAEKGTAKELGELTLSTRLFKATEKKEEDVYVSRTSNVGQLASYVAKRLAEDQQLALALRCVGPLAQQKALYACVIARSYVSKEQQMALWLRPRRRRRCRSRLFRWLFKASTWN